MIALLKGGEICNLYLSAVLKSTPFFFLFFFFFSLSSNKDCACMHERMKVVSSASLMVCTGELREGGREGGGRSFKFWGEVQ